MRTKEELIQLFNNGMLDEKDSQLLEQMVVEGKVDLEELEAFNLFSEDIEDHASSAQFNDQAVYNQLHNRNSDSDKKSSWLSLIPLPIKWAFPALFVALGYMIGTVNPTQGGINVVSTEENQSAAFTSVMSEGSTGSRMTAINELNTKVTSEDAAIRILLLSLNNDRSDHVRMTAIDELIRYADNEDVRQEMIKSISSQSSPLVLQHLSEALKIIGEKISIDTYKELMSKEIPEEIREDLEKNLHTI